MSNKWFWLAGIALLLLALLGAFLSEDKREEKGSKKVTTSGEETLRSTNERFIPSERGLPRGERNVSSDTLSRRQEKVTKDEEMSGSSVEEPKNKMVIKWKVPKKNKQEKPVWKPIKKEEPLKPKGIPEGGTIW